MRNYNCFCLDCSGSGRFKVQAEEELKENPICPICGSTNTKVLGSDCGVFSKFSSLSPSEKQASLKKRSTEHFKKEIKGKKEYLDRSVLGLEK